MEVQLGAPVLVILMMSQVVVSELFGLTIVHTGLQSSQMWASSSLGARGIVKGTSAV